MKLFYIKTLVDKCTYIVKVASEDATYPAFAAYCREHSELYHELDELDEKGVLSKEDLVISPLSFEENVAPGTIDEGEGWR